MEIEMVETAKGPLPAAALRVTDWYLTEDNDDCMVRRRDYYELATGQFVRNDLDVQAKRWPIEAAVAAGSVGG